MLHDRLKKTLACMLLVCCILQMPAAAQRKLHVQVLVVGGGTGGTAAGIQSARLGVGTLIAEPTIWLGGMLSAAGVPATDGNHNLPSGIWSAFREEIYKIYGGPQQVATGWVSNTHFEPRKADSIFKAFAAAEPNLKVLYRHRFLRAFRKGNSVTGAEFLDEATGKRIRIMADRVIDATELGDVMASAEVPFDMGMEASSRTGEKVNIPASVDIIQDMTYAAILRDFGPKADCTMVRPEGYDPMEFDGCCRDFCSSPEKLAVNVDKHKMLEYGRLPNGYYMINWPGKGNDIYLNMIPMSQPEREKAIAAAKAKTLRFVYFIQSQLGFRNLGLADDQFPSADRLPLMPYHREGRRMRGIVRFDMNHLGSPYTQPTALYRTGIAVGDYPVDHHHRENPAAPQNPGFYPVPSFNIPLGALIPAAYERLIVCEKGISVSNVINGATRLQPCVLLTGQAAGMLAALSVKMNRQPREVPVREVQGKLLEAGAYIMPYFDVKPSYPHFGSIQRTGATGILKGRGEPFQWANRTWFRPDSLVGITEINEGLAPLTSVRAGAAVDKLSVGEAFALAGRLAEDSKAGGRTDPASGWRSPESIRSAWQEWGFSDLRMDRPVTRVELAVILDRIADPFRRLDIGHQGNFTKPISK